MGKTPLGEKEGVHQSPSSGEEDGPEGKAPEETGGDTSRRGGGGAAANGRGARDDAAAAAADAGGGDRGLEPEQKKPRTCDSRRDGTDDASSMVGRKGEENTANAAAAAAAAAASVLPPELAATVGNLVDAKLAELKPRLAELDKLKPRLAKLEGRIGMMADAFRPATIYALAETAVYKFVEPGFHGSGLSDRDKKKAREACVYVCVRVLWFLVNPKETLNPDNWVRQFRGFAGGNYLRRNLLLRALTGLVAFVDQTEKDDITQFDIYARHNTVHDGEFVEKFHPRTPEIDRHRARRCLARATDGEEEEESPRKIVRQVMDRIEREAGSNSIIPDVESALRAIVDKLDEKLDDWEKEDASVRQQCSAIRSILLSIV